MDQAQVEIIPGTLTTIWGYNGLYPGPTIRARSGRQTVIRQTNGLPEAMSVHLHGGHTPPTSDGHPYDLIPPGGSKTYEYPNNQIPSTFWYHDHAVDYTGRHVYMGLAGFYIMTDAFEDGLPLPTGSNDVPLLIQDRLFNADGSLNYPLTDDTIFAGVLGDRILVNGVIQPYFEVGRRKIRFRLLNGSNSRSYRLALSSGEPLFQIGSDGGLLPRPITRSTVSIAPAERIDVVIDFSGYPLDTRVILNNDLGVGESLTGIMEFRVVRDEADDSSIPPTLRDVNPIPEASADRTRTFSLSDRIINGRRLLTINGNLFNPDRIDATPRLDDVEIWELSNATYEAHPIHIHDIEWQILDRNGQRPPPGEDGWKDTFLVPALGSVRVIGKFSDLTGIYVFHCHKLEHEDHAMMAQFEVLPKEN
jgi:spore coat protein A